MNREELPCRREGLIAVGGLAAGQLLAALMGSLAFFWPCLLSSAAGLTVFLVMWARSEWRIAQARREQLRRIDPSYDC